MSPYLIITFASLLSYVQWNFDFALLNSQMHLKTKDFDFGNDYFQNPFLNGDSPIGGGRPAVVTLREYYFRANMHF